MNYVIDNNCLANIRNFYQNVAKKYKHTYSKELMHKNIDDAINSMYKIENGLMRRQPTMPRWQGMYMATDGKWNFAYKIEGNNIHIYDACHAQNIHEIKDSPEKNSIDETSYHTWLQNMHSMMTRMDNLYS